MMAANPKLKAAYDASKAKQQISRRKIERSKAEDSKVKGFCAELNAYLNKRFHYKRYHARIGISRSIHATTKAFHLYLRWKPLFYWKPDTLVIASLSFFEVRAGHGTAVLRFIVSKANKYGFRNVALENTDTEASMEFAQKYGFITINNEPFSWTINVKNLKNILG